MSDKSPKEAIAVLRNAASSRSSRIHATKILCDAYERVGQEHTEQLAVIRDENEYLRSEGRRWRASARMLEARCAELSEGLQKMAAELIAAANACVRLARGDAALAPQPEEPETPTPAATYVYVVLADDTVVTVCWDEAYAQDVAVETAQEEWAGREVRMPETYDDVLALNLTYGATLVRVAKTRVE